MSNLNMSASFKRMVNEIYREHNCQICCALTSYSTYSVSDEVNYLTMRGGMISFLPSGKEHKVNDDGKWSREGRQDGKTARVIRKVMHPDVVNHLRITDTHYEKFSNYVASYVGVNGDGDGGSDPVYRIAVCNGGLIPLYYNQDAYAREAGGNLINSCMRHVDENYFDIFSKNPDTVSLIVLLDAEHKVHGRALLWKTDQGLCMDTVYSADSLKSVFINFAKANGISYKSNHSCHWSEFDLNGEGRNNNSSRVTAQLNRFDLYYYPYMDTMMYLCMVTGRISNQSSGFSDYRTLRCTDGSFDESSSNVEDINGNMIDEDDATYLDYRNHNGRYVVGYVHSDEAHDTSDGYRLEDDCVYVHRRRAYYCLGSEDIAYVDIHDEYMHVDDITWLRDGTAVPYDQARELSNGEYVHEDDAVELYDGSWVELSDAVQLWNDDYALKSESVRCINSGSWFLIGSHSDIATQEISNI